jgi:MoaA/NifB/PqqE/SkfB family radical SAM enzyme
MSVLPLIHTYRRYRTLQTDIISALPIVVLMPHSACNCKCVMCDIWKGNHHLRQLTEKDVEGLLGSLRHFGTRQVLMSGGEALLNPNFFRLCAMLKAAGIRITLLSTGLALDRHVENILQYIDDVIVSLDGDQPLHDTIRNIPGAYRKMEKGIRSLHDHRPDFSIKARTVIHRLNFRHWPAIIDAAQDLELQQISFLPADVTSEAFNRANPWDEPRQHEILPAEDELPELFSSGFIAESPEKLSKIGEYYTASHGWNKYPYKRCNAPWVSTVIEADGTVRPCFFLPPMGNIHDQSLPDILNSPQSIAFRRDLDMEKNDTCRRCVCSLYLPPRARL